MCIKSLGRFVGAFVLALGVAAASGFVAETAIPSYAVAAPLAPVAAPVQAAVEPAPVAAANVVAEQAPVAVDAVAAVTPAVVDAAAPAVSEATPVSAPAAPAAAPAGPADIKPMLAGADAAKGAITAKVCAACHSFDNGGANKVGPNLWNVVGAKRPHLSDGFAYSAAMKGAGGAWDYDALNAYLYNPRAAVPGNKMAYAGLKNDKDRANVIAYLRSLADKPEPLP